MTEINIAAVKKFLQNWQNELCDNFSKIDGHSFIHDNWEYVNGGGGGQSRIIRDGNVFESVGVNFSHINGHSLPRAATQNRPYLEGASYEAMGVSLVAHPHNPMVPTTHANFRIFTAITSDNKLIWWFGGGFDLTPYYPFKEDVIHWHKQAKQACDHVGSDIYNRFKKWCDDYFYLKHRQEQRGVGGIFFDDLNEWGFDATFDFVKIATSKFNSAYFPIVEKRKNEKFTPVQKDFQLYRRGRYVEFNLLFDRGTIFGIQTGGRTESILMSLPPQVKWRYNWQPEPNTPEAELTDYYLKPQEWLATVS